MRCRNELLSRAKVILTSFLADAVKKVYEKKEESFRAALTFVVVGKRHHFRFIPKNAKDGDKKSGNAPAGLLVDRDITTPGIFDFYLLSHAGLLGSE